MQLQMLRRTLGPDSKELPPIEKMIRMLDSSNVQINRLTSLIEGLLDITRMDEGKMSYQFQTVNFSALVKDVVERFSEDFLRSKNSINLQMEPDIQIECDPLRIEQVLVNLLSNALKYGSEKDVKVTLENLGDSVSLAVQDTGIGIPPEQQEQIFKRFERLVPHTNVSGMGLGLYISRQIVHAHHGEITLESEKGVGSKFTVLLPKTHIRGN
jgi:signal transduction histidine kinase